jgi:hypothetical protein
VCTDAMIVERSQLYENDTNRYSSTVQYSTVQYSTVQYSLLRCNILQYNTIQRCAVHSAVYQSFLISVCGSVTACFCPSALLL